MTIPTIQEYQAAAEVSGLRRATRQDAGIIRDYWAAHWKLDKGPEQEQNSLS